MLYSLLIILYLLLFLILVLKNLKWGVYLVVLTLPTYLIRFQVGPLPMTLLEVEVLILFLVWLVRTLKHKNISTRGSCPPVRQTADGSRGSTCGGKALKQRMSCRTRFGIRWFYDEILKRVQDDINSNKVFLCFSVFVFLLATTISLFISPNLHAAAGLWKAYFLEPILFFIVFIKTLKPKDLKFVLMSLCFDALMLSIFAIYQKFTGAFILNEFWAAEATRRVTSVFPYPNALALYLAPLVTLFIGILGGRIKNYKLKIKEFTGNCPPEADPPLAEKLETCPERSRGIRNYLVIGYWLLVIVTGLLAVYFTRSKGALLAILAGLIFYAIFYQGYRKIFTSILIISFITLLLYYFITPSTNNLINSLRGSATVAGGDSISTRLEMWNETWQMLKTRPLLGAGLAGYQTTVAPFHQKSYIEIYLYPHNIILNFWSETGLLGLIAFILIIVWFYRTSFVTQAFRPDQLQITDYGLRITLMAAMTTLLIHGLVDVPYFKNDLSLLFWLIVGSLFVTEGNFGGVA